MNLIDELTQLARDNFVDENYLKKRLSQLSISKESWKYTDIPSLSKKEIIQDIPVETDALVVSDGQILSLPNPSLYEGLSIRKEKFTADDFKRSDDFFGGVIPFISNEKIVIHSHQKMVVPIRIKHHSLSGISNSYIEIHVDSESTLNVYEEFVGDQSSYCGSYTKVKLDERATLNHTILSRNPKGSAVLTRDVDVAKDSYYNLSHISLENKTVRSQGKIRLDQNACAEIIAVNLGKNSSHFDFDLHINHLGNNGKSNQMIRNILSDKSVGVYTGRVSIHKGTKDNSAGQQCKNLLLSDESRAFSRPQLDIDTDEVICSHGATTGKIDDKLLLYLMSRGIDKKRGMAMLIQGQLKDLICKIKVPEFRQNINNIISSELGHPTIDSDDHCSFREFSFV